MDILRYLLIVVEVVVCLLLIVVILLQQSKSQGMGLAFGGGMSESLFGSRAGNVLTKITVILALVFLANTTLLGIMFTTKRDLSLVDQAGIPAPLPVAPAPTAGDFMTAPPAGPAPVDAGSMMAPALMTAPSTAPVAIPMEMTTPEVITAPLLVEPVEISPEAAVPVEVPETESVQP